MIERRRHRRSLALSPDRPLIAERYEWQDPIGVWQSAPQRWGGIVIAGHIRLRGPLGPAQVIGPGEGYLVPEEIDVLLVSPGPVIEMRIIAEPLHSNACLERIRLGGGPDLRGVRHLDLPPDGDHEGWAERLAEAVPPWLADAFWSWLALALERPRAGPSALRQPPAWLAAAIAGCDSGNALRAGVPALVRQAQRTTAHVNRTVRACFGCSSTELVNRLRLRMAERLLRSTDLGSAEVATRIGFANRSHFHRLFSAAHGGTPPGSWRRQR